MVTGQFSSWEQIEKWYVILKKNDSSEDIGEYHGSQEGQWDEVSPWGTD